MLVILTNMISQPADRVNYRLTNTGGHCRQHPLGFLLLVPTCLALFPALSHGPHQDLSSKPPQPAQNIFPDTKDVKLPPQPFPTSLVY